MSESKELKKIKKLYGEKFMHLCRELFPTILEEEGKLIKILEESFATNSRTLGEDLIENDLNVNSINSLKNKFKKYIISRVEKEKKEKIDIGNKTPYELLEEAGYDLYECKSETDIQSFKKYYQPGEQLCTFYGGRLDSCIVFWAVKKDVDKIKREDFKEPQREDEYGTSVISIQFSRGDNCTVSIKNRYNHTVNNPDATYGNDLDKIIPGLEQSFERLLSERGMKLNTSNLEEFGIYKYVVANDGRYYKYNYEMNGIYYCPGNVLIDIGGEVKKLESEKQILIDYFILDKKNKKLKLYDSSLKDSFVDCFENIKKIEIIKNPDKEKQTRIISIMTKESKTPIKIEIDKENNIIGYENQDLKEVGNSFLYYNKQINKLSLPQLKEVGNSFLYSNRKLSQLKLLQLEKADDDFIYFNYELNQISLPNLEEVGNSFLNSNKQLGQLELLKLRKTGDKFLFFNEKISQLKLPQLKEVGDDFLSYNKQLSQINLPNLEKISNGFFSNGRQLIKVNLPMLKEVGNDFLQYNKNLNELSLPQLEKVGNGFLYCNERLCELSLPQLEEVGNNFLFNNKELTIIKLPKLKNVGAFFIAFNKKINELELAQIEIIKEKFLWCNKMLIRISFPKLKEVGVDFLYYNKTLEKLELPMIEKIGERFIENNPHRIQLMENIYNISNISAIEIEQLDFLKKNTTTELMYAKNNITSRNKSQKEI